MTVEFKFTEDGHGVELIAMGVVQGKEVLKVKESMAISSVFKELKYFLIDKSNCTEYDVSADDVFQFAYLDRFLIKSNPAIVVAIVESRTLQYSLTNLWQRIMEQEYEALISQSFTDRVSAFNWINNYLYSNVLEQTYP